MERGRVKDLFAYIVNRWPDKAEWARNRAVFDAWCQELEPYGDALVGAALNDLLRDEARNQQWPPTIAELLTQIEKTRRYWDARAVRL